MMPTFMLFLVTGVSCLPETIAALRARPPVVLHDSSGE